MPSTNFDTEALGAVELFLQSHGIIITSDTVPGYRRLVASPNIDLNSRFVSIVVLPPYVALYNRNGEQLAYYELTDPESFDKLLAEIRKHLGLLRT